MAKLFRMTSEVRDDLIAYLDGELDEQGVQKVEQIIAQSHVAQHEVDMLARTWDLLAVLPTPRASAEFTQRTITMLQAPPPPTPLSEQPWVHVAKQTSVLTGWAIALVFVAWLGFSVTQHVTSTQADLLVDDLRVIRNFERYQEVDADIEFVRKLQEKVD